MSACKKLLFLILGLVSGTSFAAEKRNDLPDIFREHYVLRSNGRDFTLDYQEGQATYRLNNVFGSTFELAMTEELTVFDTEPNPDIEMCNGTVTDVNEKVVGNKRVGITYGSIDKLTKAFEGQFVLDNHTYYVESADKFYEESQLENGKIVSIAYVDNQVVRKENETFEPPLPKAPDADAVNFGENDKEAIHKIAEQNIRNTGNNVCNLDIRIDNGVYNDMGRSRNKIRNRVYQAVMTLNKIYGSTFKTGDNPTVKFSIGRIAIATNSFCKRRRTNIHCTTRSVRDSSDFLNTFSKQDASKYCLSYIFTNRNFGSVLGVAFVSGVCDGRAGRSFNTGFIVSSKRTAQFNTDLTFAHEVGHNFGSNHDQRGSCLGSRTRGGFLMSPTASATAKPNNNRFSSCSRRDINNVLSRIFNGRKKNCFSQERARLSELLEAPDGNAASSNIRSIASIAAALLLYKMLNF